MPGVINLSSIHRKLRVVLCVCVCVYHPCCVSRCTYVTVGRFFQRDTDDWVLEQTGGGGQQRMMNQVKAVFIPPEAFFNMLESVMLPTHLLSSSSSSYFSGQRSSTQVCRDET